MDEREIFDLIVRADERLKYAREGGGEAARAAAVELLGRAREAARAAGHDGLLRQVDVRLADLGED